MVADDPLRRTGFWILVVGAPLFVLGAAGLAITGLTAGSQGPSSATFDAFLVVIAAGWILSGIGGALWTRGFLRQTRATAAALQARLDALTPAGEPVNTSPK
jgi:hypothetical protein